MQPLFVTTSIQNSKNQSSPQTSKKKNVQNTDFGIFNLTDSYKNIISKKIYLVKNPLLLCFVVAPPPLLWLLFLLMAREVRCVVIGDEQVGKTSLLESFVGVSQPYGKLFFFFFFFFFLKTNSLENQPTLLFPPTLQPKITLLPFPHTPPHPPPPLSPNFITPKIPLLSSSPNSLSPLCSHSHKVEPRGPQN